MNWYKQIIHAGSEHCLDSEEVKYVRVLNSTAFFYAMNAFIFVFVFAIFNAPIASYWLIGFTVLFISIPVFSHFGYAGFGKYFLIFTIYLGIGFFSAILGKEAWAEFIYITALCVPFILTSKANSILNYIGFALSIILFSAFRFTDVFSRFALEGVNPDIKYPVMIFVFTMPFVVLQFLKQEQTLQVDRLKFEMQEKELLSKEVNHRVKNNFQVITSLFSLQMRQAMNDREKEFLSTTRNRIFTMALIHELLHKGDSLSELSCTEYLTSIVRMLLEFSGKEHDIQFKCNGGEISISLDKAVPMGLVICEVVTNSIKHAFNGSGQGEIYLNLDEGDGSHFVVSIGDNGSSSSNGTEPKEGGLGTMLINDLIDQIDGQMQKRTENGTHYRFTIQC